MLLVFAAASALAQSAPPASVSLDGVITGWHTVRPGETLVGITTRYLGSNERWKDNWALNPAIQNPHVIQPGTRLRIILDFETAPPVARLKVVAGKVEARPVPIPWNQAQVEDLLVERDGLRTYSQSSTEIEFRDGTNLVLSEESLVFVRPSQRAPTGPRKRSIEIVEGQAEVQALVPGAPRTDVEILIGSATATATRTADGLAQTRARKTDDGTAQVMVYEGASEVAAAGASVAVARGMGTAVKKDTPPSPPEELLAAPRSLEPAAGSEWRYGDPWFSWEPVEGAASHTLEICRDPRCGELALRTLDLAAPRMRPEPLPAGDYYWRVTAVSLSGLDGFPSESKPFTVLFTGQDTTGPTGTVTISGRHFDRDGTTYWAPDARLEVTMTDEQSGLDSWAAQVDGRQLAEAALAGPWTNGVHTGKAIGVDRVGNLGETAALRYLVDADGPAIDVRLGGKELVEEKLGSEALPKRWDRRKRKWIATYAPATVARKPVWTPLASASDGSPIADTYDRGQALKTAQRPQSRIDVAGNNPGVLLFAAGKLSLGPRSVSVRHGDSVTLFDPDEADGPGTVKSPVLWIGARDAGTGEVVRMTVSTAVEAGETYLVVEAEDLFGNRRRVGLRFRPLAN